METLNLPRPYLSFSQIELWDKSPETYRKKYYPVDPPEFISNMYMEFGNTITLGMEKGLEEFAFVPRHEVFERKIECVIDGVPLLGYIDNLDPVKNHFLEYKSAMTHWSENKVMKHFQLDLYSLMLEEIDGYVDDECELIWIETAKTDLPTGKGLRQSGGKMMVTGKTEITKRVITAADRQKAKERITRVAREIAEDYKSLGHLY